MVSRQTREQALLLAQELEMRRSGDPLRTFPLHDKQRDFVDSVLGGVKKENWFIAANRAGKSEAGAFIGATLARFGRQDAKWDTPHSTSGVAVRDRATSGWVSALDFPTSRDVIQPKYFDNGFAMNTGFKPFIPSHEIEQWRADDQVLKLKNGSIIGFKSAESGRRKYQGAGKDWFHMDEEHPWEIYEESVIRVGNMPLIFFCTATILPPEGIQQTTSWVFPKIIQPWKDGTMPHIGLFGASIYDNPGIARDEIRRLEAIYPEGSVQRRIRLMGEWLPGLAGARAYPAFDRMIHVNASMPEISLRRPLLWVWDFNVEPMVSLIFQQDGLMYRCYRELILESGSIPEMCDLFYHYFPEHGSEIRVYGDATGKGRAGATGKSSYWTIQNEMKGYGVPISIYVPEENPRIPDRINAMNRIMRDEDGMKRLEIDPSCVELTADLEGVLRDQKGGILKISNKKDPYFRRTHTSDAAGYLIAYEEPVRPVVSRRGNRISPALTTPSYFTGGAR